MSKGTNELARRQYLHPLDESLAYQAPLHLPRKKTDHAYNYY